MHSLNSLEYSRVKNKKEVVLMSPLLLLLLCGNNNRCGCRNHCQHECYDPCCRREFDNCCDRREFDNCCDRREFDDCCDRREFDNCCDRREFDNCCERPCDPCYEDNRCEEEHEFIDKRFRENCNCGGRPNPRDCY